MLKPKINPMDWITVGIHNCVVMKVYLDDVKEDALVVFNNDKPTTHNIEWTGSSCEFSKSTDNGGYPLETSPFVQKLKRGK